MPLHILISKGLNMAWSIQRVTLPIAPARFAARVGDGHEEGPMGIHVSSCHAKTLGLNPTSAWGALDGWHWTETAGAQSDVGSEPRGNRHRRSNRHAEEAATVDCTPPPLMTDIAQFATSQILALGLVLVHNSRFLRPHLVWTYCPRVVFSAKKEFELLMKILQGPYFRKILLLAGFYVRNQSCKLQPFLFYANYTVPYPSVFENC